MSHQRAHHRNRENAPDPSGDTAPYWPASPREKGPWPLGGQGHGFKAVVLVRCSFLLPMTSLGSYIPAHFWSPRPGDTRAGPPVTWGGGAPGPWRSRQNSPMGVTTLWEKGVLLGPGGTRSVTRHHSGRPGLFVSSQRPQPGHHPSRGGGTGQSFVRPSSASGRVPGTLNTLA